MTESIRRAAAFAAVATLSLAAPVLGIGTVVPFGAVAIAAAAIDDGPVFDLFARPIDRREGRLNGLLSFALAAAGVALLVPAFGLPPGVFVATVLLAGYGNLAAAVARTWRSADIVATTGYVLGGFAAAIAGQFVVAALSITPPAAPPKVVFLAASGALLAALLRETFPTRQDPLMLASVSLMLWLFVGLPIGVGWRGIAIALAVTVGFGYVSWALDTASITGMLTGVFVGLLTVVVGGYGWLIILLTFFGVGGFSSKFRYDEKAARGVAEQRGGARGGGNVLGNAAPALAAVVLFAVSDVTDLLLPPEFFRYAFAGSLATALGDTLSSEIGGLYDDVRLVTTLEPVEPGTDGGVTLQGEVAGVAGAAVVAGLAATLFDLPALGAVVVIVAGFAGMTADSLLGAVVEGGWVGNQTVNFLATATGAVAGGAVALAAGLLAG